MYNPQLDTFICVAELGSFSKAGEVLYISPTAVIKQMNQLEDNLGLKLFERTHKGVTLTDTGKSFYNDTKYIIQYCKDTIVRAKNTMQNGDNIIRIGTSPMTPCQYILDIWDKIHNIYLEIKFKLIPYDNTPENAREILKNLGNRIDIVAGIFDSNFLKTRQCDALLIEKVPLRCAVSIYSDLAKKDVLSMQDLYDKNLMIIRRGWNAYIDLLRDYIWENHLNINIVDFDFFNMDVLNQCENSNSAIISIDSWQNVHPLLKIIPVEWNYVVPFGILHSKESSKTVKNFLKAIISIRNSNTE